MRLQVCKRMIALAPDVSIVSTAAAAAASGSRYECSLYFLTKKFVGLVKHAEDGILDLNSAVVELRVKVCPQPLPVHPIRSYGLPMYVVSAAKVFS